MGFLSDFANSIPVLGNIKGLYHYARGEEKEGDEAMYQSTRSSLVIAGGLLGGPPGAIGAGVATDTAASALMKKEKGLINSCKNIGEDIASGRNPTRSIASAGLQITLDGMTGYGSSSSGLSNASKSTVGKTMRKGGGQFIQKSVRISSAEAAKNVGRKSVRILSAEAAKNVGRKSVAKTATNVTERALVASTRYGLAAFQRSELQERERGERVLQELERESEWQERERERRERKREQREREREWREQREREREWREQEQREREWREIEWIERVWREQEQREREWREREQREREWEEIEWIERVWRKHEQREREWIEREQRKREQEQTERERECKEQEQKEKEEKKKAQQKSNKQKESKKKEQRANKEKQKGNNSGSNSGSSQPPQDNKDNNNKCKQKNETSSFETFMTLLKSILKIVYGNENEPFTAIFENLSKEDRKYLAKVLKPLKKAGTLEAVIELVIRMFKQHFHRDISFLNFLSLLEFIQTYITDELLERTRISSGTETAETKMDPKERREKIISEIVSDKDIIEKLMKVFSKIKTEIEAETVKWNPAFPNFRNIFAAVYHYFKHRKLPRDGKILSVAEYYYWIKEFLNELEQNNKFTELKNSKDNDYVHQIFMPIFHRRYKIVLKIHNGKIVLSSAYVVTKIDLDDIDKHAILIVIEIFTIVFMALCLLFIIKNVLFYGTMLLLNTILIFFKCIAFIVKLPLNILLFFFSCFIFMLKIVLYVPLLDLFLLFLFFYRPDER